MTPHPYCAIQCICNMVPLKKLYFTMIIICFHYYLHCIHTHWMTCKAQNTWLPEVKSWWVLHWLKICHFYDSADFLEGVHVWRERPINSYNTFFQRNQHQPVWNSFALFVVASTSFSVESCVHCHDGPSPLDGVEVTSENFTMVTTAEVLFWRRSIFCQ